MLLPLLQGKYGALLTAKAGAINGGNLRTLALRVINVFS